MQKDMFFHAYHVTFFISESTEKTEILSNKKLYMVTCEHFANNMTEHQTDITFSHEDLACGLSLLWNALKITNNADPWFILQCM